jgi:hypothetical protein
MLIRFRIVPLRSFFPSSYLGVFFCSPAFFLTCEFYDGGIPMLTTFFPILPSQTDSEEQGVLLTSTSSSIIYNPLLLLLQLSTHTITIIHPHLIGISPLHCHFISLFYFWSPPFSVATFEHYFDAWHFFWQSPAICNHSTYFRPTNFLFWYSTSQRNLALHKHYYCYITSEKITYSFN